MSGRINQKLVIKWITTEERKETKEDKSEF